MIHPNNTTTGQAKTTILVADDNRAFLAALTIRIESMGYAVVTAEDAVQAVHHARTSMPAALVLDIHMPAGDGFCVEERIRKIPGLEQVPVFFVTGDQSAEGKARIKRAGAMVFPKPCDTDALLFAIAESTGDSGSLREKALKDLQDAARTWTIDDAA